MATSGHYVLTYDFGGADGITLGDEIDAAAIFWSAPITQTASAYLHDELHYRDWLRRSRGADLDDDMAITAEEWGLYKGSFGVEESTAFEDIDLNGDGLYTRETTS